MNTAVIYARYSSDNQREESIDGQIRECTEYAQRSNIRIVGTYIDRALSASKETDKRLDFQRMIRDSASGIFDTVLVWKLDRFARDRFDSAHYKHILKKNGVRVVSAKEAIADGPEGIILESMLEGMAEYYSKDLSVKVRRGHKENALKGKSNGGNTPFGYRVEDHELKPDPATAPVALEIFKRYANGEGGREITEDLNRRGIRTRTGRPFTYSSLGAMLKNRIYVGVYHYGDIVIPGRVPPIVPQEIFDRVQARTERNKHAPAMKKATERYLLTTKIFCGDCGSQMAGESGKGRNGAIHRYYKCRGAKIHKTCQNKAVKKEWIEEIVVRYVLRVVNDEQLIQRLIDKLLTTQGREHFDRKLLQRQLAEVNSAIDNMLNAIQAGIITPATKERLTALESRRQQLDDEILKEQIKHPQLSREQIELYLYQFRQIDTTRPDQCQRLIDSFLNSVYVFSDRIVLTFNYAEGKETIPLQEIQQELGGNGSDLVGFLPPIKSYISEIEM